jgi:hypothetical protein
MDHFTIRLRPAGGVADLNLFVGGNRTYGHAKHALKGLNRRFFAIAARAHSLIFRVS